MFDEKNPLNIHESSMSIKDIIDGMYDWVRVLDRDDNVIFVNNAMAQSLKSCVIGQKCYEMVGRNAPCENCISRKAVFEGKPQEKEEIINDRIFAVMSSPVKNSNGDIVGVVEVLRDVTEMKKMQRKMFEQNKKLQDDLEMAKKLQCSLLPKHLPEDKVKFSFIYKPCEALGGDFLDIFKIGKDHVGLYIADVSGHGVSASMLTVFLRSTFNKFTLSPAEALEELYREFNKNNFDGNVYITVFYAILDLKQYKITYSNAGHNVPPVIFSKDRFDLLRIPGIPISSWMDTPGFAEKSMELLKGDKLFFYTDGVVEIRNHAGEQFGEERLLDALLNESGEPVSTLNKIIDNACEFASIKSFDEIMDDITMALLEIK